MDAIYVDPILRQQASQEQEDKENEKSKGKGWRGDTDGEEASGRRSTAASTSGFLNAVQMGVGGVVSRRREYSLAPCHHLFVSRFCVWMSVKF